VLCKIHVGVDVNMLIVEMFTIYTCTGIVKSSVILLVTKNPRHVVQMVFLVGINK